MVFIICVVTYCFDTVQKRHDHLCSSIFSCFPVEIVRLIFEHSGRDSGKMASRLVGVCRLVQAWLLPVLYETLLLKWPENFHQISSTLTSGTSNSLARHVRHVSIQVQTVWNDESLSSDVAELLVVCQNLQSLYLDTMCLPLNIYVPGQAPHLTHLHCGSWGAWMTHDIMAFHALTHLRVDLSYNSAISPSWRPLLPPWKKLPRLTHLAVGCDQRTITSELHGLTSFLRGILSRPDMVMLVVTAWCCWSEVDPLVSEVFNKASDPRLCILMTQGRPTDASSVKEWEDAARGRQTIWNKAEMVIKRHQDKGRPGVAVGLL